jgi:hypothetical protein
MASSKTTTDHGTIREWAEARGGRPVSVKGTGAEDEPGVLRIDFPGYSGGDRFEEIEWEEWFEFPRFQRLLRPDPLPLIKDGQRVKDNMRRQLLTEEELTSHLRLQGVEQIEDVKEARMEADGRISVVPFDKTNGAQAEAEHPLLKS